MLPNYVERVDEFQLRMFSKVPHTKHQMIDTRHLREVATLRSMPIYLSSRLSSHLNCRQDCVGDDWHWLVMISYETWVVYWRSTYRLNFHFDELGFKSVAQWVLEANKKDGRIEGKEREKAVFSKAVCIQSSRMFVLPSVHTKRQVISLTALPNQRIYCNTNIFLGIGNEIAKGTLVIDRIEWPFRFTC